MQPHTCIEDETTGQREVRIAVDLLKMQGNEKQKKIHSKALVGFAIRFANEVVFTP